MLNAKRLLSVVRYRASLIVGAGINSCAKRRAYDEAARGRTQQSRNCSLSFRACFPPIRNSRPAVPSRRKQQSIYNYVRTEKRCVFLGDIGKEGRDAASTRRAARARVTLRARGALASGSDLETRRVNRPRKHNKLEDNKRSGPYVRLPQ